MDYDLGIQGLAIVIGTSLTFGLVAQLVAGRGATWMWLLGAAGFFLGALIASEVLFAWATVDDLQPQIDGLSFDEALLGGMIVGIPTVLVGWIVNHRRRATAAHT
jgi:hypothetical protein